MRNIFGPSQTEAYQQIANELNAEYHEVDSRSKSARGRIDISFQPWRITVDISESENVDGRTFYTRVRAPFVQDYKEAFEFELYRGDVFTRIGKLFGMQDIEIGDSRFDKDFIIQGNNAEMVQTLLDNPRMREILSAQQHFHFTIDEQGENEDKGLPKGTGMLTFKTGGVITDLEKISTLVELFKVSLEHMTKIGLIQKEDPEFLI